MKTMLATFILALASPAIASPRATHATSAPTARHAHAESPAVASARHELELARTHLASAKAAERADRKARAAALKARIAKLRQEAHEAAQDAADERAERGY